MVRQKGFTLVELLVVIAIIALLMSILMPALSKTRQQAKEVVCQSNLRQWGNVFAMYVADNDGKFNRGWPPAEADESGFWAGGHSWPLTLLPYYQDMKLRFCPSATKSLAEERRTAFWAWIRMDTVDPSKYADPEGSYGTNEWTGNQPDEAIEWLERDIGNYWRTANVRGAYNIPLILDCAWAGGFFEHTDTPPVYEGEIDLGPPEGRRYCINRHNRHINGCFVDFSVRKLGLKQLWTLKWHQNFAINGPWTLAGGAAPDNWPEWMRNFNDY